MKRFQQSLTRIFGSICLDAEVLTFRKLSLSQRARGQPPPANNRDRPPGMGPPRRKPMPQRCRDGPLGSKQTNLRHCEINLNEDKTMKIDKLIKRLGLMASPILFWLFTLPAHAVGTEAGSVVANTATIDYNVGTVAQTAIESSPAGNSTAGPGNGTATDFSVDHKVDVTVAEQATTYIDAADGTVGAVITFVVTNTGNAIQDFQVTAANNATDPFGGTENFDPTTINVFVDVNGNGTYESATDTATFINELSPDPTGAANEITVFVVSTLPGGQADGDIAAVTLTATARDGETALHLGSNPDTSTLGGAITKDNAAADGEDTVESVFADIAGDTDALEDGAHSDTGAYQIVVAVVSISKTQAIIYDASGYNKHLPGVYVQYTITISNDVTATGSALLTTISDALDTTMVTFDADLLDGTGVAENAVGDGFRVTHTSGRGVTPATQYFTSANDADGVEFATPNITADMATVLPAEAGYSAGELMPGEDVTLVYNVRITP